MNFPLSTKALNAKEQQLTLMLGGLEQNNPYIGSFETRV